MNLRRPSFLTTFKLLVVVVGLMGICRPAAAVSIYDASVALHVSAGTPIPFRTSLTLLPGVTLTPPPFVRGAGDASGGATANVPGQVKASANGVAIGNACGPVGECEGDNTVVNSRATAIGLGFLSATSNVSFPLTIHETWNVAAVSSSIGAKAGISFQVLVDNVVIYDGAAIATAGGFAQGVPADFESNDAISRLRVALTPGIHNLVFIAEANGLAETPEPATLLLVGTTAAGLGLARWRQRRRAEKSRLG